MTDATNQGGNNGGQGGDAAAAAAAAASAAAAQQTPEQKAAAEAAAAAAANQTPEQKAAAEKAAAEAAKVGAGKVPEKYEAFKLPEGVTFSAELQTGLEAFARKSGLDQAGAQGLAEFAAEQLKALNAAADKTRADWLAAAKADPEVGGDKLTPALAGGAEVIATFGNAEFKAYLDKSGLGNHPEMIRMFARIRAAISQDKFVPGGRAPAPKGDARTLYPNSNMNP